MANTPAKTATFFKITPLALAALLAIPAFADDDVGPDRAVKLVQEGTIKSFESLNQLALAKHPGATITETSLEQRKDTYIYEVELSGENRMQWEVEIDAVTGTLLNDRQDR